MKNNYFYFIGIIFLLAAKLKSIINGYNPRSDKTKDLIDRYEYNSNVIKKWMKYLDYYDNNYSIENKNVIEIGPGSDLGIGITLINSGVKNYYAIDTIRLANPNRNFIKNYLKILNNNVSIQKKNVNYYYDRLNYLVLKNFELGSDIKLKNIDYVFSQASMEHWTDVEKNIKEITKKVRNECIFIAEIDLQTHSRWIRESDPLNIYRYSEKLYSKLRYIGQPNRFRPKLYKKILEKYNWKEIEIIELTKCNDSYLKNIKKHLDPKFKDYNMRSLSVILIARYNP